MRGKLNDLDRGQRKHIEETLGFVTTERRVVTRSPHRAVGKIACSWIQDQAVEYESQLERRFLQRLLLCLSLEKVRHQPFTIDRDIVGEKMHYTPDFLVRLRDGAKLVVEVKPEVFIDNHRKKLLAAKALLNDAGVPFFVITDTLI